MRIPIMNDDRLFASAALAGSVPGIRAAEHP